MKALTTQLQEQTRQINDAISYCEAAIQSGDASQVPDTALRITADFRDSEYTRFGLTNGEKQVDFTHIFCFKWMQQPTSVYRMIHSAGKMVLMPALKTTLFKTVSLFTINILYSKYVLY